MFLCSCTVFFFCCPVALSWWSKEWARKTSIPSISVCLPCNVDDVECELGTWGLENLTCQSQGSLVLNGSEKDMQSCDDNQCFRERSQDRGKVLPHFLPHPHTVPVLLHKTNNQRQERNGVRAAKCLWFCEPCFLVF